LTSQIPWQATALSKQYATVGEVVSTETKVMAEKIADKNVSFPREEVTPNRNFVEQIAAYSGAHCYHHRRQSAFSRKMLGAQTARHHKKALHCYICSLGDL
jgi:acetyl-CoA acetyltransferase